MCMCAAVTKKHNNEKVTYFAVERKKKFVDFSREKKRRRVFKKNGSNEKHEGEIKCFKSPEIG